MICVDASVGAKWILDEEHSESARALYDACTGAGEPIVAPPLLPIEVTNILRQRMRRDALPLADAVSLSARFSAFPVRLVAPADLYQRALVLADSYGLPAAYDAHYVALAQLLACDLWTHGRRLLNTLGGRLTFVKDIASYQPGDPV